MLRAIWLVVATLGLLGAAVTPSWSASISAGAPLFLDPSVPSVGRGGASTAVFWDDAPNYWANPALLAFHRGIRFERNDSQLVPELTEDVFHRTRRWTVGAYGVGVAVTGDPWEDLGRQTLNYGTSTATDAQGRPLGEFEFQENWSVIGVGVSLAELVGHLAPGVRVEGKPLRAYGDIAVGYARKEFDSFLSPELGALEEGRAQTTVDDWGVFVRATPLNSLGPPGSGRPPTDGIRLRVDLSAGYSVLNSNDATLQFFEFGSLNPIARMPRLGFAAQAAVGLPYSVRRTLEDSGVGWLAAVIDPLLRVGLSRDTYGCERPATDNQPAREDADATQLGWEVTMFNVLTLRGGHVEIPDGDVDGSSSGSTVGLRLGRLAGIQFDRAKRPQASDLGQVDLEGWSAFVDPIACWQELRRAGRR